MFENSIENSLMMRNFRPNFETYHNIIAYISGYIGRRLSSMMKCAECVEALICLFPESHDEEDGDHGYDDLMDDVDMNGEHDIQSSNIFNSNICEHIDRSDTATMNYMFFDDDIQEGYEETDTEYCDNSGENAEDSFIGSDVIDDEGTQENMDLDLGQFEEIVSKYLKLIKEKDRGGLFYPSDSLYRIAILSDVVFVTALKESGNKMLKKNFTLNRLVGYVTVGSSKYSDVLFKELKEHFLEEATHEDMLIQNIAKFYLKIRIDFLNKTVSANSGKRQKVLHTLHFQGM